MKDKVKYSIIGLVFLFLFVILNIAISYSFDNNVSDTDYFISLDCPEKVSIDEIIDCELNLLGDNVGAFEADLNYLGLEYIDFEKNASWDYAKVNDNKISAFTKEDFQDSTTLGILKLKVLEDIEEKSISASNVMFFNDSESIKINDYSVDVRLISDNADLEELSVEDAQLIPAFSSNVTDYSIITEFDKITINAVAPQYGSVTGTGEKKLNYGLNEFEIESISESGVKKIYKLSITRLDNRSNDCDLKSVNVSSGNIDFNKEILVYNLVIDGATSNFSISGEAADSNSSIAYPNGQFANLNYGETKQLVIKVTSENGNQKDYVFNIFREDNRSNNSYLKSININSGIINFNKEILVYNVKISSKMSFFSISGEVEDIKSSIAYPNGQTLNLNYGETKQLVIRVTSESKDIRNYVFNVTREDDRSSNANLKSLSILGLDLDFKSTYTSYGFVVENNVNQIDIKGEVEDFKSTVTGLGKKDLNVGNNIFNIIVTAENGYKKTYIININRKKVESNTQEVLSDNNELHQLFVNEEEVIQENDIYKITVNNFISNVNISGTTFDEKASIIIDGNTSLSVGENVFKIKVISESGKEKVYDLIIYREPEVLTLNNDDSKIVSAIKYGSDQNIIVSVPLKNINISKIILDELNLVDKTLTYNVFDENEQMVFALSINSKDIVNSEDLIIKMDKKTIVNDNREKSVSINFDSNKEVISKYSLKINAKTLLNETDNINLYKYNSDNKKYENLNNIIAINDSYVEVESDELSGFILTNYGEKTLAVKSFMIYVCIAEAFVLLIIILLYILKGRRTKIN